MNILNARPKRRAKDLNWYLCEEYPLRMFSLDREEVEMYTFGPISQMLTDLGVQRACIESIETNLRRLHRDAQAHPLPGRVKLTGRIRLFCQKNMIDEGMKGGCGYFVIERSRDSSVRDFQKNFDYLIDLYLYEEGE